MGHKVQLVLLVKKPALQTGLVRFNKFYLTEIRCLGLLTVQNLCISCSFSILQKLHFNRFFTRTAFASLCLVKIRCLGFPPRSQDFNCLELLLHKNKSLISLRCHSLSFLILRVSQLRCSLYAKSASSCRLRLFAIRTSSVRKSAISQL